jgi:hypothetical protein
MAAKREHLVGTGQVKGTMIQAHLNWLKRQNMDPATGVLPGCSRDHEGARPDHGA